MDLIHSLVLIQDCITDTIVDWTIIIVVTILSPFFSFTF